MAEFWIQEYHIDGLRIDEFKGINNWDFVQTFRHDRAWAEHGEALPGQPFLVIAEDSWRARLRRISPRTERRLVADAI